MKANVHPVEGFLSLAEAAQKLETTLEDLARQISEGRIVVIAKNGQSWISPGEIRRLARTRAKSELGTPAQTVSQDPAPATEPSPQPSDARPAERSEGSASAPVSSAHLEELAELRKRCEALTRRAEEAEGVSQRLKIGIGETEGALRRSRTAKQNLENDVISLTEQLKKAQTRSGALEREVQHLTHELERSEEKYANDMRRFRKMERGPVQESGPTKEVTPAEVAALRQQMLEKDRIINQEYQERAVLRAQLDEKSQKYFELKARYDKEKSEWSEILARELQTHGHLKSQLEEANFRANNKGWNPFRRDK